MRIEKQNVNKDMISCNFCQKGELNKLGQSLIYPYKNVIVFIRDNGNGLCACICENCLDELYAKGNELLKS